MLNRLNKFIADSGVTSRRKADELISQGRVEVNGKVILDLGFKVNSETDIVEVDGTKIKQKNNLYFLLNKPKGFITSTTDEKKRRTVVELIDTKEKIYPVGRLDYNTTGLLILTNDGDFTNLLTHPSNRVPRVYEVQLNKQLEQTDKEKLLKGIYIDSKKGKFIEVNIKNKKNTVEILCHEGRNHFVKRMFSVLGYNVEKLNRKMFAGIILDIPVGAYRKLSNDEIDSIKNKYAN